jgi:hypothetical protein
MDWLTIAERFGVPVAMAVWLLVESRSSRRALELREIRHQEEMARREQEAVTRCATREADMTKRIRELEESRMRELRAANAQYLTAIQAVADALRDFAAQDTEFHRAVRHLYEFLRRTCAHGAPPPPGEGTEVAFKPSVQVPDLLNPPAPDASGNRKSNPEIRVDSAGGQL